MQQPYDHDLTNHLNVLLEQISASFNLAELHSLCFKLGVDHEELPFSNEGKTSKSRELVLHIIRHRRITDLIEQLKIHRPLLDWPDLTTEIDSGKSLVAVSDLDSDNAEKLRVLVFTKKPEVFLSCSFASEKWERKIRQELESLNMQVWPEGLQDTNQHLDLNTQQNMRRSDAILILINKNSEDSIKLQSEFSFAQEIKKLTIFIVVEETATIPSIFQGEKVALYSDFQSGIHKIVEILYKINAMKLNQASYATVHLRKNHEPKTSEWGSLRDPFVIGPAVPPEFFFGREVALEKIQSRTGSYACLQSLSIVANRRMGKTSLFKYVKHAYQEIFGAEQNYTVVYIDASDARAHTISGIMRLLRRNITRQTGLELWEEPNDGKLALLSEAFEELADYQDTRLVLLLDEWEAVMAHPELDPLIESLRSNGSLGKIGMITATAYSLPDLYKQGKLASPFYNIFLDHYLGNFIKAEWEDVVSQNYARNGQEPHWRDISLIGELAGGHPYLTQLAGSLVWQAEQRKWNENTVRKEFAIAAEQNVFWDIWQRLDEIRIQAIRQALDISPYQPVPENVFDDLISRGVLTHEGNVFCTPFAEFVYKKTQNQ